MTKLRYTIRENQHPFKIKENMAKINQGYKYKSARFACDKFSVIRYIEAVTRQNVG